MALIQHNKSTSQQTPTQCQKPAHSSLSMPTSPECDIVPTQSQDSKPGAMKSTTRIDLAAGILAGIVGNLISHPLDTIKVRMQLAS